MTLDFDMYVVVCLLSCFLSGSRSIIQCVCILLLMPLSVLAYLLDSVHVHHTRHLGLLIVITYYNLLCFK